MFFVENNEANVSKIYLAYSYCFISKVNRYEMALWSNLQFNNFKDRLFLLIEESLREYRIYEGIDIAALYLEKHPVLCLAVMASGVACFIPVVIFMMFAVISFLITFTGFVVIEGTIIGIGLAALIGFLVSLLLLLIMMTAIVSTVYFTFVQIFGSTKKRLQPYYTTIRTRGTRSNNTTATPQHTYNNHNSSNNNLGNAN